MRRSGRVVLLVGVVALALYLAVRTLVGVYTEALWFDEVGYGSVFWTRLAVTWITRIVAAFGAATLVFFNLSILGQGIGPLQLRREYGNLEIVEQVPARLLRGGAVIVSLLAGWWLATEVFGGDSALAHLAWLRQVDWGVRDPLFQRDLSFYVFSLPVYFRLLDFLLAAVLWCFVLVILGYALTGGVRWHGGRLEIRDRARLHLAALGAVVVLLLGVRYWLGRYGLLLEGTGIGGGLGYTDVQARLPARRALAILALFTAASLVFGAWYRSWAAPAAGVAFLGIGAIAIGRVYPAFIQKFRVEPNQFAMEAPYIGWNVDFTRQAYGLHNLVRRTFPYRRDAAPDWDAIEPRLRRIPLWDEELLGHVFNQVEPVYAYYHFHSVDADRYGTGPDRTQVAIAVREFQLEGLPSSARTWQSLRLNSKYNKGMGVVVSPAAGATSSGEPIRWLRNIDPVVLDPSAPPGLRLTEPAIYFGERLGVAGAGQEYVFLRPGSDSIASTGGAAEHVPGIQLGSLPRILALAWRFRDKNLLFSGELSADSRIVFRRSLADRLLAIAPFLVWDPDAQPVIDNGRIVWLVDGYVATSAFPLARSLSLRGIGEVRYLRNGVKATVDAVTGRVTLYAVDTDDPILATYRRAFPHLIRDLDAMPQALRAHLRYPVLYLRAQAEILKEYHLDRQEAFFAGQDFWQLPGGSGDGVDAQRPLYTLMALPGEEEPEFILSTPFIARERQNMTALLVARNDPPHYGELILYELPRDQQILGPLQVAALMEQDPAISPQLALWGQRGSVVRMGPIRAIPLDSSFLYLRPVFLSARETSIPELARVIVSDGRNVRMAPTVAEAVRALREPGVQRGRGSEPIPREGPGQPQVDQGLRRRALELLLDAERHLREGDFAAFGASWAALRALLRGDEPAP